MKCPKCMKNGKKSRVYLGGTTIAAVYYPLYYDEDGNLKSSGVAPSKTEYTCSRGHKWTEGKLL